MTGFLKHKILDKLLAALTVLYFGGIVILVSSYLFFKPIIKSIKKRVKSVDDTCCIPGIDHVFKKDGKFYIVESKYNTAKLSKLTDGTKQMSDAWIKGGGRLRDAVGDDLSKEIIDEGYTRLIARIDTKGQVTYKKIDKFGTPTDKFSL